ncbi:MULTISPECIES: hypothetical protein [Streptomyces]|uniref:Uncharacterized protein n=1 Tax=Streptomyces tsukubensis (strain DSM 42081 / NBRC 108919 / NRRL 18488 / 9993) TaxID=1114943 RepID=I2N324_STRT9|nr:hypothetical protein [Streptomyces tsukubensis]MYS66673.1 hypothetical protein [Streptomyces sp. SID5473]AZK95539.1 hypothetical protein B7R87_17970 [Streptomyces tsukubensis]EIF91421.1 hypothetical protein [Streptomyces tsukubensis NRRL18488]QKM68422.1 hypothetical protein STSU_015820 [Streptomyces tsukubensis NRRL18488]TAI43240.1 hypothetical protein EWI31_15585 [Streptomyces tsukubensis]
MNATIPLLLATADRLLTDPPAAMAAGRFRGAAFALRTALEIAVSDALLAATPAVRARSTRAKLLCLRCCTEAETARRAKAVWKLLCLGCHYHHYEIGPTASQLALWRSEANLVVARLGN